MQGAYSLSFCSVYSLSQQLSTRQGIQYRTRMCKERRRPRLLTYMKLSEACSSCMHVLLLVCQSNRGANKHTEDGLMRFKKITRKGESLQPCYTLKETVKKKLVEEWVWSRGQTFLSTPASVCNLAALFATWSSRERVSPASSALMTTRINTFSLHFSWCTDKMMKHHREDFLHELCWCKFCSADAEEWELS